MVNVKYTFTHIMLAALFVGYFFYIAYETSIFDDMGQSARIAHHLESLADHGDEVNALILGGSNAAFGLSAEQLSRETGLRFYNLALAGEGHNSDNYIDFIDNAAHSLRRDHIKLVVFSTFKFFQNPVLENHDKDVTGKALSVNLLAPKKPLLKWLYETDTTQDTINPRRLYSVKGDYGDLDYTSVNCDFTPDRVNHDVAPLSEILSHLKKHLSGYSKLFPNAQLVVVIPSLYQSADLDDSYLVTIKNELPGMNAILVVQSPFASADLICDRTHHPNAQGRAIRTHELAGLLATQR